MYGGILSLGVYGIGNHFHSVVELKADIIETYDNINAIAMLRLVTRMPHNMDQIIYKNIGYIGYQQ